MKERLKEWLLRKLVRDLIDRYYGVHLMTVLVEENVDHYYESNYATVEALLSHHLRLAMQRVRHKGDPLL